ncbi:DUF2441 domain-containing protein [Rhodococcus sp. ACS1]|jgi:hypothetical protein|uniref:DUF2441 domain-containing protein n=1 Tax=Rhodococcus sp. ACS1 TaxID=2028570 RepID=UPI000BB0F555|nr:DUF2441 domain-containing protein [Rhodococcus sp. ACS1]PBC40130.1 DUF2441 domain-containing protein [Rhodococcus sp. ACS1]
MPRFYTVDRRGTLHKGQTLGLTRYDDVNPSHLQRHLDVLFPDGVAAHGENNFVNGDVLFQVTDHSIELIWENVRRAHYPTAPSRFQSAFAVDTLEQAHAFRTAFDPAGTATIWQVETAHDGFRANMDLLRTHGTALMTSYHAHCYWSQQSPDHEVPVTWEILLPPPVHVTGPAE